MTTARYWPNRKKTPRAEKPETEKQKEIRMRQDAHRFLFGYPR